MLNEVGACTKISFQLIIMFDPIHNHNANSIIGNIPKPNLCSIECDENHLTKIKHDLFQLRLHNTHSLHFIICL